MACKTVGTNLPTVIYRNWLQYVASKRTHVSSFSVMAPVGCVRSSAADEIA